LLLIKGLSYKEIATVGAVSERTVREQGALDLLEGPAPVAPPPCRRSSSTTCSPHRRPGIAAGRCGCNGPPDAPKHGPGARASRIGSWSVPSAFCTPAWQLMPGDAPYASPTRVRPYGGCARGSGDPTPETGTESVIPPDRSRGSPGRLRERRAFPPLRRAARSGPLQPVARGEGHVQPGLALACMFDDETGLNPLLTNEAIDRSA
jgi:hypothetical protein